MRVSLIQMNASEDKQSNILKANQFMDECVSKGADIICLPEKFLCLGNNNDAEDGLDSPVIDKFKTYAKSNNVNIILGSLAIKTADPNKTTNTCLVINRVGNVMHRYDKKHMYIANINGIQVDESEYTAAGNEIGFFELEGVKMGVGICVDLRYPEYFRELVKLGVEIIFLPSSFNKGTGQIAWDILTQARAIENQLYFCGCNHSGGNAPQIKCGNTRIVSYDGTIICNANELEGSITSDIDLVSLREHRKNFPLLSAI